MNPPTSPRSAASEASTSGSTAPDGAASDRSRSTPPAPPSSHAASPASPDGETSPPPMPLDAAAAGAPDACPDPTSSAGAFHAKTFPAPASVAALARIDPGSSSSSLVSVLSSFPVGFSSRTSLGFCRPADALAAEDDSEPPSQMLMPMEEEPTSWRTRKPSSRRSSPTTVGVTWRPSSGRFPNSGIASATGLWTLSTSEFPSDAAVSSLSDILEPWDPRLQRYCLTQQACSGILRRAQRRGRALPTALLQALEAQVPRSSSTRSSRATKTP